MLFCVVHTKRRAGREFSFFFLVPLRRNYRTVLWPSMMYGGTQSLTVCRPGLTHRRIPGKSESDRKAGADAMKIRKKKKSSRLG